MEISIQEIAILLNGSIEGDPEEKIKKISKIQEGEKGSISFLSNDKYEPYIYTTKATAVIVDNNFISKEPLSLTLIRVKDPYYSLSILLKEFQKVYLSKRKGIEHPSHISSRVSLGKDVYIGAFSYIEENVKIEKGSKIFPQVSIGKNVEIGENTIIYSGVQICANTQIGNFCAIHSGAIIGNTVYSSERQVTIKDHVNIGANSTIDGGGTLIEEGVKLDNLIQVGKNVKIGKNTVIAAQTGILESTTIGRNCMIGGQVGIASYIEIADRVKIGAATIVKESLKEKEVIVIGHIMMKRIRFLRSQAIFKKLPELSQRIKKLEEISRSSYMGK